MKTIVTRIQISLAVLAISLAGAATSYAQLNGTTFQNAKNAGSGTLRITFVETPGFVYRDGGGQLSGVCIDILEDFAAFVKQEHGINLSLSYEGNGSSFANMYNQAKAGTGGVIGVGNITITEARRSEVAFTPYFIENKAILITQKGKPMLTDLSNIGNTFSGMVAYTAQGTLNERRINSLKSAHWPGMPVEYAASSPDVLNRVLANPNGFAYLDLVFYVDAVKNGKPIQRHAVADDSSEQFGFVMPRGTDWAPIWEAFFNNGTGYRNSTEYKRALMDHLGPAAMRLLQATN